MDIYKPGEGRFVYRARDVHWEHILLKANAFLVVETIKAR